MKYYTSTQYTGKTKKKKILRIVLLVSLALGILIGTAMLGNLLRDRLTRAEKLLALSPEDYAVGEEAETTPSFTKPPRRRQTVETVVCTPVSADAFRSREALTDALSGLSDGISVTVTDAEGARFAFSAFPSGMDDGIADVRLLTAAAETAAGTDTHLSATLYTSFSAVTDGDVLAELALCGVRDVVICGLTGETLSPASAYTLLVYLDYLRDRAPDTAIGIALSPALFRDADAASSLDQLAEYFDYLALDLTERPAEYDDAAAYAAALSAELYGSIQYYNLAVRTDADGTAPEALSVWTTAGIATIRSLS